MKYLSRIFSILLFLVLVTSAYVGHTVAEFAKSASGDDASRITKFGITTTCTANAFSATYGSTVKSAGSDDVFAPGTSGTFSHTVTGVAEVRVQATKTATITMNDSWTNDSGTFYCPLTFTIGDTTINGLNYTSKDAFIAALKTKLEEGTGAYASNYNFSNAENFNRTITWSWPFNNATGSAISQSDANDNALGNKSTKPNISITMDIQIVQVD